MEFPFSGNSSQGYGSIYITAYIPSLPYYPFPWQCWTTVGDCLKAKSEMLLLRYLWETKLSSPGLRSCEATTDPCCTCVVLSEGAVLLIPPDRKADAFHGRETSRTRAPHQISSLKISLRRVSLLLPGWVPNGSGLPWLLILGTSQQANHCIMS